MRGPSVRAVEQTRKRTRRPLTKKDVQRPACQALALDKSHAKFHVNAAKCCEVQGDIVAARRHYENALEQDSRHLVASAAAEKLRAAEKDVGTMKTLLAAKKHESCGKIVARLLEIAPACVEFQLNHALCLLKSSKADEANVIACGINLADNSAAEYATAMYYRGLITCQLTCPRSTRSHAAQTHAQGLDVAMTFFERGLASDASSECNARALKGLGALKELKAQGSALYKLAKYKEAADVYTRALEDDAADEFFLQCVFFCNRALCQWKMSNDAEAINDCSRSLEAHPLYQKARMKRYQLYVEHGDYEMALDDVTRAVELDPDDADLKVQLRAARRSAETSEDKDADHYKLLGIEAAASASDIKRAYRKAAILHHPDRVQGDEQKRRAEILFKQIAEAYRVLSAPDLKSDYDYDVKSKSRSQSHASRYDDDDDDLFQPRRSPFGYGRSSAYQQQRGYGYGGFSGFGASSQARYQSGRSDPSKCHSCGVRNFARDCSQACCKRCCDDEFCPRH